MTFRGFAAASLATYCAVINFLNVNLYFSTIYAFGVGLLSFAGGYWGIEALFDIWEKYKAKKNAGNI